MFIYTVRPGDTLGTISARFGVSPLRVAADNLISQPSRLAVGQSLIIMADSVRYTIRQGQTLYSLAQEYGVPLDALIAANPELNPFELSPGDRVTIPLGTNVQKRPIYVNGFAYPTINTNSLNCVLPFLSFISPFGYSVTAHGDLIIPDDGDIIYRALRSAVMPLMVVTNIYNGQFSSDTMSEILHDNEARQNLINGILHEAQRKGYYGVLMDIEYIPPADRQSYNSFLRQLTDRLHDQGFIVMSALAPKISANQQGLLYEAHDYAFQGRTVDFVIIMTYEWGYLYGPPMAVSPIDGVRSVLDYAVSEIPPEKLMMSLPNYGYDWTLPYQQGTPAATIALSAATELAVAQGAEIRFDERSATPYFNYTSGGREHVVWFDDPRSLTEKLKLIDEYGLAGVSYWTVNRCYLPNWLALQSMYEIIKL